VGLYQKGKTNLDFTEARDSEWQWHQLGHMQVCTSLQTDNHASTPTLSFLQAGCPSCRPTNSVKALKAKNMNSKCQQIRKSNYNTKLTKHLWKQPTNCLKSHHRLDCHEIRRLVFKLKCPCAGVCACIQYQADKPIHKCTAN